MDQDNLTKAMGYLNEIKEGLETKGYKDDATEVGKKIENLNKFSSVQKLPTSLQKSINTFVKKAEQKKLELSASDLDMEI